LIEKEKQKEKNKTETIGLDTKDSLFKEFEED